MGVKMNYKELVRKNKDLLFLVKDGYIFATDTNISKMEKTNLSPGVYTVGNGDLVKTDQQFSKIDTNMNSYKEIGEIKFRKTFIESVSKMDNDRNDRLLGALYIVNAIAYATDGNIFIFCYVDIKDVAFAVKKDFLRWLKIHKEWDINWIVYENEKNIMFLNEGTRYIAVKDIIGKFKNALNVIQELLNGSIKTLEATDSK